MYFPDLLASPRIPRCLDLDRARSELVSADPRGGSPRPTRHDRVVGRLGLLQTRGRGSKKDEGVTAIVFDKGWLDPSDGNPKGQEHRARDLDDYVALPASLGLRFDLVIVDGRKRCRCLTESCLAPGETRVCVDPRRPAPVLPRGVRGISLRTGCCQLVVGRSAARHGFQRDHCRLRLHGIDRVTGDRETIGSLKTSPVVNDRGSPGRGRNILVVSYFYPPFRGSGSRWHAMAHHLRSAGHRVQVVSTDAFGRSPEDEETEVIRVPDLRSSRCSPPHSLARPRSGECWSCVGTASEPSAHQSSRSRCARGELGASRPCGRAARRFQRAGRLHRHEQSAGVRTPDRASTRQETACVDRGLRDGWSLEPLRVPFPTSPQRRLDAWLERRGRSDTPMLPWA